MGGHKVQQLLGPHGLGGGGGEYGDNRPGQAPSAFGAHLHAVYGADDDHRGIRSGEGGEHLAHEVCIAGRIEEVQLLPLPFTRNDRHLHAAPALDLFWLVVGDGVAVGHLPQAGNGTRGEQQRLGQGRGPRAAVGE